MRVNIKFVRDGSVVTTVVDANSVGAAISQSIARGEQPLAAWAVNSKLQLSNV